jgi:hypothetical protein
MSRIKKPLILILVLSCALTVCTACAGSEMTGAPETKLQQVALFKNGLGFFVSEVTIPYNKDSFSFVPLVAASHGTFWVSCPAKVRLKGLVAEEIEKQEQLDVITINELLKANMGREVAVWLSADKEPVSGTIKYFAEERDKPNPDPYSPGRAPEVNRGYIPPYQPLLMIIDTDAGDVCINPQMVQRVDFIEGVEEKTFSQKSKSMQLVVSLGAPAGGQKLAVSHLARGITWAPSYIVDISDADKARLAAKAVVINEACDLDTVTLQLVTGFPHLQFADIVSPLALKENLAQFIQALTRGQSRRGMSDIMYNVVTQQRAAYSGARAEGFAMPEYGAADAGKVAEDLFFYPIEKVQLKKGAVGYYPLFTESMPYKHIYQWNIPDYVNEQERYVYERRPEQQREPEEEVWHCLRLQNSTKVPWTTAPAETVKEGLILGQDTLNYTPVKGETTLKITQAVSVKAEQLELEIDRKRDAAQLYGYHYDLITIQGKLSVSNFQNKDITLEITKTLSGEVKSSEPQVVIESLAKGLLRMNAIRKLTWTIELQPGERKELTYIYEVYVRR